MRSVRTSTTAGPVFAEETPRCPRRSPAPGPITGVLMVLNDGRVRMALGTVVGMFVLSSMALASSGRVATLDERLTGASDVVVATARNVNAEWRDNDHGDRIIVSRVELEVSETLKGSASRTLLLEIDGGTRDGFTLQVSGLPLLASGDRAVFFLGATKGGVHAEYLRGQGILLLDGYDGVRGSSLRLNDIRVKARSLGR